MFLILSGVSTVRPSDGLKKLDVLHLKSVLDFSYTYDIIQA